jgi:hypothetical protein
MTAKPGAFVKMARHVTWTNLHSRDAFINITAWSSPDAEPTEFSAAVLMVPNDLPFSTGA